MSCDHKVGRKWLLNTMRSWYSFFEKHQVPFDHLRRACPSTGKSWGTFNATDVFEARIFREATISTFGLVTVLARYSSPRVAAVEGPRADEVLCALFRNHLPGEWDLVVQIDTDWPLPWSGQEPPGFIHGSRCDDIVVFHAANDVIDISPMCGDLDLDDPLHGLRGKFKNTIDPSALSCSIQQFVRAVMQFDKSWLIRQVMWSLAKLIDQSILKRDDYIRNPLHSPRPAASPGCRQDRDVLKKVLGSANLVKDLSTADRSDQVHTLAHIVKGSNFAYNCDRSFLKEYMLVVRRMMAGHCICTIYVLVVCAVLLGYEPNVFSNSVVLKPESKYQNLLFSDI